MLDYLFGAASFIPHGYCLLWRPDLVALHGIADGLIALAYFSIPVSLWVFVRRRPDLEFGWVFGLFAAFILFCGLTHLVGLVTIFQPIYGFEGLVKAATALVSVTTAALIWPVVPRAIAMPGTAELQTLNAQLLSGIEAERRAGRELRDAFDEVERRVEERTHELAAANDRLQAEIRERERAERHQQMLLAELRHRTRNTLAIVKSIAAQTRQHSGSIEAFSRAFNGRVQALADTHSLLFESNWTHSSLDELIRQHLRPYEGEHRATLAGPTVRVRPKAALSLSLVLHELAANAAKYGALSTPDGLVQVQWWLEGDAGREQLSMVWRETGGPEVEVPASRGFGSEVVELTIKLEFDGDAAFEFAREGVIVRVSLPLVDGTL